MEFLIVVLVIGAFLFSVIGVIILLVKTGSLSSENRRLARRIDALEETLSRFARTGEPETDAGAVIPRRFSQELSPAGAPYAAFQTAAIPEMPPETAGSAPAPDISAGKSPPALPDHLIAFIRGGNYWAGGGIALLTAGFATLITYLARRGFFTLEMGIAGAAITGMALLVTGWLFRKKRPVYCLLLQGGGIGILYLAVFAAFKFTPWFSRAAAFGLLFFLTLPALALALLQNSQLMAVFGFAGAFAAPLLVSSGGGNYIFLFSYYLGLNIFVLGAGFFRFWRGVNLTAFGFTYFSALVWLFRSYKSELFRTSEPFFAAFIVIFTVLAVHGAGEKNFRRNFRRDARRDACFDGILLFGNPLLGAMLQWRVFSFVPHGHALISIVFAAFYLALALLIRKYRGGVMRLFVESYLGLAVLLANIAVPLELSPQITGAIWAAEGVLFFFLGMRLKNSKVVMPALALHAGAAAAFALEKMPRPSAAPLFRSSAFSGSLVISLAAISLLAVTLRFGKRPADGRGFFSARGIFHVAFSAALGLWFYAWWFGGWFVELKRVFPRLGPYDYGGLFFILCAATTPAAGGLAKRLRFPFLLSGAVPSVVFAAGIVLYATFSRNVDPESRLFLLSHNFFHGLYRWGWPLFFAVQGTAAAFSAKDLREEIRGTWIFVIILTAAAVLCASGRALTIRFGLAPAWRSFAGLLPLFAAVIALSRFQRKSDSLSLGVITGRLLFFVLPLLFCGVLGIWFLVTLFLPGDPAPLPRYVPVLNPLDLLEAFSILIFLFWQSGLAKSGGKALGRGALFVLCDTALFLFVTALLARSMHFYAGIPYGGLFSSDLFQIGLFVTWALYGVAHIVTGTRGGRRKIWIAGAALTAADIGKFLILDLSKAGALIRIASFFIAGIVLLFIGWVSPLPPSRTGKGPKEIVP